MELREIYRGLIMAGLQKIIYTDNESLFQYSSSDHCRELRSIQARIKHELQSPRTALKDTSYERLTLQHCITLSGYSHDDGRDVEHVEMNDYLLVEDTQAIAKAMIGDHPFIVKSVKFKKAYLGMMCIHHYCEIEFAIVPSLLQKLAL